MKLFVIISVIILFVLLGAFVFISAIGCALAKSGSETEDYIEDALYSVISLQEHLRESNNPWYHNAANKLEEAYKTILEVEQSIQNLEQSKTKQK